MGLVRMFYIRKQVLRIKHLVRLHRVLLLLQSLILQYLEGRKPVLRILVRKDRDDCRSEIAVGCTQT